MIRVLLLALLIPSQVWADGVLSSAASSTTKTTTGSLVGLETLLACEDQTNNLCMVSGGVVRQTAVTMGAAATANGTTAAFAIPTGSKTFYGQVVGTGAVTQTQAIYGDIDNDAANGILLCTLTLTGTTRAQDACPVITANFKFCYVITTATTGTSATGAIYAMY